MAQSKNSTPLQQLERFRAKCELLSESIDTSGEFQKDVLDASDVVANWVLLLQQLRNQFESAQEAIATLQSAEHVAEAFTLELKRNLRKTMGARFILRRTSEKFRKTLSMTENEEEKCDCPMCEKTRKTAWPCGHAVCFECSEGLRRNDLTTCPFCKLDISSLISFDAKGGVRKCLKNMESVQKLASSYRNLYHLSDPKRVSKLLEELLTTAD